jgi:maltose alpha-D-glucosyltransferase/alpha-amylase
MARGKKSKIVDDPLWYKDAVIYQLHVKSFFDSNNDGIGDFPGLLSKMDYIVELGVDAIWLLPFYPSPRRDDGYDISEYLAVHPDYGTLADVRKLIATAHARGIRVITELVVNHTSDQHSWFQRARRAKPGSNHRNHYVWSDSDHAYAGTRIIFVDTEKSNWTWDPVACAYFWHRFYSHQPDLNFENPTVMRKILGVMRYWLALGVDGLRLDAVPYLIEREGTSNENLPETHAILKTIRANLDRSFPGRMLLAEANMWPEDTQEYFGQGDECHMAFHFPLMPRIYMSIAREDRFPITDIMRQTPDIPENCQWAIFLRNHDELTLEMVTDSERDYLWQTYAADRRARINLGIRRRLAPLVERDRRRIELMNSLLLSMPGTPVLYYGDEIGMGDNIHLGDRDGVRTPMQWSPDRNGGFSRADPERLVLPPIMDSVAGYEAVNVEAQTRNPHSLLNWTRRMLALRRNQHAFGRGSLRFLYPRNRKILAYLREYGDATILCVANLARASQAVELDLAAFAGRVPVEMLGGTAFPPIGQLTYLLTLAPYGFYWFELRTDGPASTVHEPAPEQMPEYVTIVIRSDIAELMGDRQRRHVEGEALPPYLTIRRWFASKNEKCSGARLSWIAPFPGGEREMLLAEVAATVGDRTECYLLPLGIAWEDAHPTALQQQLALTRIRRGRRVGFMTDAFALDAFPRLLLAALKRGDTIPVEGGEIRFLATDRLTEAELPAEAAITWIGAEQSNSSLLIGEFAVLKLVRRIREGLHPEAEMTRHLTRIGYANSPPLLGEVVRMAADGPHTLAIVQGFLRNQGDAWRWTLDFLGRTIDDLALVDHDEAEIHHADAFGPYERLIATLGRRLGELHVALARPSDDADFDPEIVDEAEIDTWITAVRAQVESALDLVAGHAAWADEAAQARAAALLGHRSHLVGMVSTLARAGIGTLRIRVHGDFHLGQVLVAQDDVVIIDFEGEPSRSLAERRRKASPLRDVAGLLRSLDYAAAMAPGAAQADPRPAASGRREAAIKRFATGARAAFLAGYGDALAASGTDRLPTVDSPLTDLFLIEKAAYEICYEAANRPGWVDVPLRGLAAIAERLDRPDSGARTDG